MHGLSQRQWDVAVAIYDGLTYKEIASRLGVSEKAVKSRADEIRFKWGLRSKIEVILRMIELKSEVSKAIKEDE